MNKAFSGFKLTHGLIFDYIKNKYPTRLHGISNSQFLFYEHNSTYYVYISKGFGYLRYLDIEIPVIAGMYLCIPGDKESYLTGDIEGIAIERIGFNGVFQLGGPIEDKGRLKYIDGCTDSLLVPPVKLGDPCLNVLYFPSNIDQTEHTHPSMRVGMIASGSGTCVTPEGEISLTTGMVFIIHEDGLHKFRTGDQESMVVIAYHPDSDFGPEDEKHPMINRTIVDGISASELRSIQTK